jgi:hypothetical protein
LRQLRRTCEAARAYGVDATAVVIGDDTSVDYADELGFATVRRNNEALGRKFNDGYQLACDPEFNPQPADFCVPCGSDDWIDPVILERMPTEGAIGIFRLLAVVNEDRNHLMRINYRPQGGVGIRIIPHVWLQACGYRPAEEHRKRAIDTSTLNRMYAVARRMPRMVEMDVHSLQIVDWKTHGQQLNSYAALAGFRRGEPSNIWDALAEHYPVEALEEMRALTPELVAA